MKTGQPIVEVEGVSKRFFLPGHRAYDLRERFRQMGLGKRDTTRDDRVHWALQDVSFTVEPGQTLGIVGHNGSGKSTMLKLLTGIMAPTKGRVKVRGRIGALIEVGAGFHPDLSGRENVYLSGSIQGLSRRELVARFDQIVDFANMAKFIDMPVKRYSSGMYMRLGFSLAVHTDPDLLLIDEVLAVGDWLFQQKCIRHLKEFVRNGGTVVFVSHSMAQVAEICSRSLWLDHGQSRYLGDTATAVDGYMAVLAERQHAELKRTHPGEWEALEAERIAAEEERIQAAAEQERRAEEERLRTEADLRERTAAERHEIERLAAGRRRALEGDSGRARLIGVTLRDSAGVPRTRFHAGDRVQADIRYELRDPLSDPIFGFDVFRITDGMHMFTTSNYDHAMTFTGLPAQGTVSLQIQALNLPAGTYRVQVNLYADAAGDNWWERREDLLAEAIRFTVEADVITNGCAYLPVSWLPASDTGNAREIPELLAEIPGG